MRNITDVVPKPVAKTLPNESSECQMCVTHERLFGGEKVTVDASGSSDRDESISSATLIMTDGQGRVVEEKAINSPSFIGQLVVRCGGTYTVQAKVTDNKGAVSTSSSCEKEVAGTRRLIPVAAVGYMHMLDPANFLTMRGGLEYWLNEEFSIMGMLGYIVQILTSVMDGHANS